MESNRTLDPSAHDDGPQLGWHVDARLREGETTWSIKVIPRYADVHSDLEGESDSTQVELTEPLTFSAFDFDLDYCDSAAVIRNDPNLPAGAVLTDEFIGYVDAFVAITAARNADAAATE
jgi:hypothetical protein